jgi:hypothetical protein
LGTKYTTHEELGEVVVAVVQVTEDEPEVAPLVVLKEPYVAFAVTVTTIPALEPLLLWPVIVDVMAGVGVVAAKAEVTVVGVSASVGVTGDVML